MQIFSKDNKTVHHVVN